MKTSIDVAMLAMLIQPSKSAAMPTSVSMKAPVLLTAVLTVVFVVMAP